MVTFEVLRFCEGQFDLYKALVYIDISRPVVTTISGRTFALHMRATLKKLPSDISAMALGDAHGILSSLQHI